MKRKNIQRKNLVLIVLFFLLFLVCLPVFYPIRVNGKLVPYEYTIHGTYIEINRYMGMDSEINIPAYLWFRPVRKISGTYLRSEGAFENIDYITAIKIPNTVNTLTNGPFWGCWNLERVEMSRNISVIPAGSFTNCKKLKEIVLGKKVENIYGNAFAGCISLERVIFQNPNTQIDRDSFGTRLQPCNLDILTLVSAKDSAVEKYAKEHGIKWEELEE